MKKLIPLLLALCLLLGACGKPGYETMPLDDTEAPTDVTTEPSTVPETTAGAAYHHPLTGEALDAPMTNRPVAVVINNIVDAQPLHGIGDADVLFETTAEGGGSITRCLAVFTDLADVEKIGSVRSARTYFTSMARSFDAPLIHCGGSEYALSELKSNGQPHIDARYFGSDTFYRDAERKAKGYAIEHTLFTKGQSLLNILEKKNIATTVPEGTDYGWTFAEDATPDGETANKLSFRFSNGGKYTIMEYDTTAGCYHGTQKWGSKSLPFADANSGKPVDFENVIILYTKITSDSNGYRVFAKLDGTGDGYYAANGKMIPIKWSRADDKNAPFRFLNTDGTPITLSVGKTYIGILNLGLSVNVE